MDLDVLKKELAQRDDAVDCTFYKPGTDELFVDAEGKARTMGIVGPENEEFKRRKATVDKQIARSGGRVPLDEIRRLHLACAVTRISPNWTAGGKPIPFTFENVAGIFQINDFLEQGEAHHRRTSAFFGNGSIQFSPSSDTSEG